MSTPFSPKSWQNSPTTTTPLSAAALIDLETRLSTFSRYNTVTAGSTHSTLDGELTLTSANNFTCTIPTPVANGACAIWAGTTVTNALPITVTTPSGTIFAPGGSSSASLTLGTPGDYVLLYSDGTNWFDVGGQYGMSGSSIIATSESRTGTKTAYNTMPTADQVTGIVLPTSGLLAVWYQATWQESVQGAASAAIFLGAAQLKLGTPGVASPVVEAGTINNAGLVGLNVVLASTSIGLISVQGSTANSNAYSGDVTTGQVLGGGILVAINAQSYAIQLGGPCYIFAAAGTYTVTVQYKASSGDVTASNRRLYVQAQPF